MAVRVLLSPLSLPLPPPPLGLLQPLRHVDRGGERVEEERRRALCQAQPVHVCARVDQQRLCAEVVLRLVCREHVVVASKGREPQRPPRVWRGAVADQHELLEQEWDLLGRGGGTVEQRPPAPLPPLALVGRRAVRDLHLVNREAGEAQPLAHHAKRVQAPAAAEPVARARAMRRPQWLEGVELPDVRHRGGLERNGRRLGHASGTGGASCVEEALVGRPGDTPHEQQIPPCCVAQHHRLERSPPAPRHAVEQRRLRAGRRGPEH
mmetsp:Transcript_25812/g.76615  ORF Transcript_25812/g.76615 Transcript_25812/m.76615 type:complete len:265 (-) Transcript_25812:355-1149(-)